MGREFTEQEKDELKRYYDRALLLFFYDQTNKKGKDFILDIARMIYEIYADEEKGEGNVINYPR